MKTLKDFGKTCKFNIKHKHTRGRQCSKIKHYKCNLNDRFHFYKCKKCPV